MKTNTILVASILLLMSVQANAAIIHQWNFSGYSDGIEPNSVEDSFNEIFFDSDLDGQASVQNSLLKYRY